MIKNGLKDISVLTTIPYFSLQNLFRTLEDVISYDVKESLLDKENICEIDIGIGTLNILVTEDEIKYKFIPSKTLSEAVINSVQHKDSPLVIKAEQSLSRKIMNTYKDLF
jgi:hypothetical protein